jgi:hypothetical protein
LAIICLTTYLLWVLPSIGGVGGHTRASLRPVRLELLIAYGSPVFAVAAVLALEGWYLALGRRKRFVITVAVLMLAGQVALHVVLQFGFFAAEVLPGGLQLLAVALATGFDRPYIPKYLREPVQ